MRFNGLIPVEARTEKASGQGSQLAKLANMDPITPFTSG
jgi:hypothetical protein